MSDIPEFHGNPNDLEWNPEYVFNLKDKLSEAEKEIVELRDKYNDLIMQVANKFLNETRHETALRYIKQAEKSSDCCASTEVEDATNNL